MKTVFLATAAFASAVSAAVSNEDLCMGSCDMDAKTCTFKFVLDVFASETGYYKVEGCDGVQPTLGMYYNYTYTFDQSDETNWFHPLGFAYGPDGVYLNEPELEKGVVPPGSDADCGPEEGKTVCQYPQYKLTLGEDGVEYDLCDACAPGDDACECDPEDFGLDQYEGVYFSGGRDDWLDIGSFSVDVTITDTATTELFYFCHIHKQMSGRIKMVNDDGEQVDPVDYKELPYEYHTISEFDRLCGTHNVSQFRNGEGCPGMTFMCNDELDLFGQCMVAINCAMHVEMRTTGDHEPSTTFMHQMIAHHRNAVNMAKILLKENPTSLACGTAYDGRRLQGAGCDTDGGEDGGRPTETMLWEIINGQNQQITFMRSWLEDNTKPTHDYCEAKNSQAAANTRTGDEVPKDQSNTVIGLAVGMSVGIVLSIIVTYYVTRNATIKEVEARLAKQGSGTSGTGDNKEVDRV